MTLREQMAVSIEQTGTIRAEQQKISSRIEALELAQAQHGWISNRSTP
jgi:NADH:ubiquinone oxidoreductase subunit E